jgi:hypothetical protein
MKHLAIILFAIILLFAADIKAQEKQADDKLIESNVISLVDKDGFIWQTAKGDFVLKPYMLVYTRAQFQYVDDEGLELADEDNYVNMGFGIPNAYLGFAGKAFDIVSYNFTIDAAKSGASLINQAWIDLYINNGLRVTAGKFKTPMNRGYLVRAGQTLFPALPSVLSTRVNLPYSLNSVNPVLATGFDTGVMLHGLFFNNTWQYQVGVFNGTGSAVNTPDNTLSDDLGIPSLLYAARLAYMPYGPMPIHEGDPKDLNNFKLLAAVSSSYNVEANYESSNDLRIAAELAMLVKRFYFSSEFSYLNMDFIERQRISPNYNFWGAYAQCGYFISNVFQPVVRVEVMDRNSQHDNGILYMPSVGFNYFIVGQNLKLQTMYQFVGKSGHDSDYARDDDDNGLGESSFITQLQFSF